MLLLYLSETGLSIVSFGHLFGPCWLKYELNMHPDVSKIILDTLRPASSKIRIIEISNLVQWKDQSRSYIAVTWHYWIIHFVTLDDILGLSMFRLELRLFVE